MPLPDYIYYIDHSMPVDELISYYNEHLKGNSKLYLYIPATDLSELLDSHLDMPLEEFIGKSFFGINDRIDRITNGYHDL